MKLFTDDCSFFAHLLFLFILFLLTNCASFDLTAIKETENYRFSAHVSGTGKEESVECKVVGSATQWYILFGSIPINRVRFAEIFPKPNQPYRVTLKTTWLDGISSLILGVIASVTMKSILVESCDSREIVLIKNSSDSVAKDGSKINPSKWKEDFIKENEKQWKEEFQERIYSDKKSEIDAAWLKEVRNFKNLSVLLLRSGEIVKGQVTKIDVEGVRLYYKGKERVFPRKDVMKVRFQE
ncbi:hypothetical protein EHQ12_05515 [Leptospira gomenensis]|uniref:Uncharacterized protein n=1 Tax=Leptospira gomenensis TaxID=2484974 RepID=A0A5F1YAS3_9LEPT|nr:hypothetical protein EHQ17_08720 [Leptospira gomenensis]TGK40191.1 hypothetical protein EHQ07_19180 [Leptospira gomenensis]TGK41884.1 hypothetical protein EHQ12_05515 [Leptospira gomenensis]TGK55700.1 hypothetical protein EHQ13_17405 [Leptospira gomenensis]